MENPGAANRSASCLQEEEVEQMHRILGSDITFSSKPSELDEKAVTILRQINLMDRGAVQLNDINLISRPQDMAGKLFLCDSSWWRSLLTLESASNLKGQWKIHSHFGYGIQCPGQGFSGLKRTFVYYDGNRKTNWIMNVYHAFSDRYSIKTDDIAMCHVFQSDNYDPRPKHVPSFIDFEQKALDSRAADLESLITNPRAFADTDEFKEYFGAYTGAMADGSNGKRAGIWEHFTEVKVEEPDGKVVLTLAICHHCSVIYVTGKDGSLFPNNGKGGSKCRNNGKGRSKFSYHGTKTITEHYDKMHNPENPQ